MLDWGEPGEKEKSFGIENYVSRVNKAIEQIEGKITLVGYCMGGLMALASALNNQKKLNGLALLATPWDFHSPDTDRLQFGMQEIQNLQDMLSKMEIIPKELIYLMFYFLDPWPVHSKYSRTHDDSDLLAREHWVHDGIAMARKVAEESFIEMSCYNVTQNLKWRILDKIIDPANIQIPTFVAIPSFDRVVPPLCARPLAELIPGATTISCPTGHVGMIVGKNAREHLWAPLVKWLSKT